MSGMREEWSFKGRKNFVAGAPHKNYEERVSRFSALAVRANLAYIFAAFRNLRRPGRLFLSHLIKPRARAKRVLRARRRERGGEEVRWRKSRGLAAIIQGQKSPRALSESAPVSMKNRIKAIYVGGKRETRNSP
jgi:hypothetical protein